MPMRFNPLSTTASPWPLSPTATPRSWRSHIRKRAASWPRVYESATTPSRRSSNEYGSDRITSRGTVSQYEVVCISFSGMTSSPAPTFSFDQNLIFLKPTTCEVTCTSPWQRRAFCLGSSSKRSRMRTFV